MTNGLWAVILQEFLWIRLFGFISSIYRLFSITYICLSGYSINSSESIGVMQVTQCLKLDLQLLKLLQKYNYIGGM